jgi:S1-C subfamily serine protease
MALRAALHNWRTRGLEVASSRFVASYAKSASPKADFVAFLRGKLAYLQQARGKFDPLWARYAIEFAECSRRDMLKARPVTLRREAAHDLQLLRRAVWLVSVVDERDEEISNGTGFWVEGHGLVTNWHVVDLETIARELELSPLNLSIRAAPAHDQTQTQGARIASSSKTFDLAALQVSTPSLVQLAGSDTTPSISAAVKLVGFPNHVKTSNWRVESGTVTQVRFVDPRTLVQLSARVLPGNSGGPIIDDEGNVVAVATNGSDNPVLPDSGVHIRHLAELSPQPQQ